jgi:hypothetical protein
MVGAAVDIRTKLSPDTKLDGADLSPESTDAVEVKIMIESVITTITLGRIRRIVPPPSGPRRGA